METRYGVRGTIAEGIFFTESAIQGAERVKELKVEISRQNSNLAEVKAQLAQQASALGANAIMRFRYGQKRHEWWQLIAIKWDTESWFGEGIAVRASEQS